MRPLKKRNEPILSACACYQPCVLVLCFVVRLWPWQLEDRFVPDRPSWIERVKGRIYAFMHGHDDSDSKAFLRQSMDTDRTDDWRRLSTDLVHAIKYYQVNHLPTQNWSLKTDTDGRSCNVSSFHKILLTPSLIFSDSPSVDQHSRFEIVFSVTLHVYIWRL